MSTLHCRCCESPHVYERGRKQGEFIPQEFSFYACRECGFMTVEPFSGFEIYDDAYYRGAGPDPYVDYEAEYRDWRATDRGHEFGDLARIAELYMGRSRLMAVPPGVSRTAAPTPAAIAEIAQATDVPPLRWLDFGCGAGGFLKFLRERRTISGRLLELSGHDVGSYADLLRREDGFRILDWSALGNEPAGHYDVISMVEVIEHLPDPVEPLALVARLLKPGGLLLLTTGNLHSRIARRQGIHYRYCTPEIHVSLFNPICLNRLYQRVGLQAYSVKYDGAVRFKVLKALRHHRRLHALATGLLSVPPLVRAIDALYGVSAMPCAVKPIELRVEG